MITQELNLSNHHNWLKGLVSKSRPVWLPIKDKKYNKNLNRIVQPN